MKVYSIKTKKTPQKIRTLYNVGKGLPSDNITRIAYGKNGVLFAGTENGLAYYNGTDFTVIEGITEKITALYFSSDGHFYVGTTDSVYILNDFAVLSKQNFPDAVVDIAGDANGDIWLATVSTCYRLNDKNFERRLSP